MKCFKNATLVVAVLGLLVVGWSSPASAHCKPKGPHAEPDHPGCTDPSGDVHLDIEYVPWGGRNHNKNVQLRVQVRVGGQEVEADVDIAVDVCQNEDFDDFMLDEEIDPDTGEVKLVCSIDRSDPVHFAFMGTTSLDNSGYVLFNITPAPFGCYITTVNGVLIGEESIDLMFITQTDDTFCKKRS